MNERQSHELYCKKYKERNPGWRCSHETHPHIFNMFPSESYSLTKLITEAEEMEKKLERELKSGCSDFHCGCQCIEKCENTISEIISLLKKHKDE